MRAQAVEIRSGELGDSAVVEGYRAEHIGEAFVERVIWGQIPAPRYLAGTIVADTGYIWYRFWLPHQRQVVERYYAPDGRLVGTQVDVCGSMTCDGGGCRAVDLMLDIWLAPDGRVTMHNEAAFEEVLSAGACEAESAERHVRELTAAIASGRFPPPLVRNWQVDLSRLK